MDKKLIFNEHGERGTQSMIGGNTTNLREWNRIKYDWANQMYRTMLNNFWIPEEISLNEDVKQFPYLTDYERRAFDKIIAFLNFLDSSLMHTNVSATILAKQTLFIQSLPTIS